MFVNEAKIIEQFGQILFRMSIRLWFAHLTHEQGILNKIFHKVLEGSGDTFKMWRALYHSLYYKSIIKFIDGRILKIG